MHNSPTPEEIRDVLENAAAGSRRHFLPYRKIFLLWGLLLMVAGCMSQVLADHNRIDWIPFVWTGMVSAGILVSRLISRRMQEKSGVKPALLGYFVPLWIGCSAVIVSFYLIASLGAVFSPVYLSALSFPVIALATLVSGSLFRSRALYIMAGVFFAATIPAVLYPALGFLIQIILMGGGLVLLGLNRDA